MIVPIAFQRPPAAGVAREIDAVAELLQQHALEPPQRRLLFAGAEDRERGAIGVEERLVPVLARQQPQEQLVQVVRRQQPPGLERRRTARRFGGRQRAAIRTPRPRDHERLERPQHGPERRLGAPRAVREQRHAPVVARHEVQDPAAVAPRPVVQEPGRLELLAPFPAHGGSWPSWRSMRSSSLQPSRTLTQVLRCTRRPNSSLSASRAARPTDLSRAPFAPMTILRWPTRSTQITASISVRPSSVGSKRSISTASP